MPVRTFTLFFSLLTVAANLAVAAAAVTWLAARRSRRAAAFGRSALEWVRPNALGLAWVVALVATAGSLYYSEVAGFQPCRLCWYQRIAMYPMALLLGIAAIRRDTAIRPYALGLSIAGALISIYHYQLERFPAQGEIACAADTPCTFVWFWSFHYISLPFMALSAFTLIATLMLMLPRRGAPSDTAGGDAYTRKLVREGALR